MDAQVKERRVAQRQRRTEAGPTAGGVLRTSTRPTSKLYPAGGITENKYSKQIGA